MGEWQATILDAKQFHSKDLMFNPQSDISKDTITIVSFEPYRFYIHITTQDLTLYLLKTTLTVRPFFALKT